MKWRLLLVLMASLFTFTPARAADWKEISSDSTMSMFVDVESIGARGKLMRAWFMYDYKKTQSGPGGKPFRSLKILVAFNCSDRTLSPVQAALYGEPKGGGEMTHARATPWEILTFEDVIPDSIGEYQLQGVCRTGQSK